MILYDSEHKTRASNLASKLKEQSADVATCIGPGQVPACKDATLTIWGHGGPDTFANLAPAALQALVSAWKARNPQLTTVELVTCDARHVQNDRDSYTDKLMPLLIFNSKSLVRIRTLPRGGSKGTWSELYAMDATNVDGYYFVAGDTEAAMKEGVNVLQDAVQQVSTDPKVKPSDRFMAAFPVAKAVNDKKAMKGPLSYVSTGGSFMQLRDRLVPVTTYAKDGNIIAVPSTGGSMTTHNQLLTLNDILATARLATATTPGGSMTTRTQLLTLNDMLATQIRATARTPGGSMTTRTQLLTLNDMLATAGLATASTHPLGLRARMALADEPSPDSLFDMLKKDKQAPSSTVIAAVSAADAAQPGLADQLGDVMMLTSFISVAASRYLYQTTYKDRKPDITTPGGASEFVKVMANAKNFILTSAMAGYLSSESLLARSYQQSTTSADLHMGFLSTLFDGFNFPKSTITELDSVLTSVAANIGDLKLSWSDENSTLDHMVFIYYFDSVQGIDVKVPKVRIYFLHIDQASWTASMGKSSVTHFEFNMNFTDGIYPMDVTQTASDREKIKALLTTLTGQSMDDLNKLLSPAVVNPNPS